MSIVFNLYRNPNDGNSLRGDYPNGDFPAPSGGTVTPIGINLLGAGRIGFYVDYSERSTVGTHTFYVCRTHGTTGAVTVDYSTSGDTHTTVSGTLSWADGEADIKSFTATVSSKPPGDHRIVATLSNATGGAALHNGANTVAYGLIDDDTIATSNALFIDANAGVDGSGTEGSPFNNWYSARAAVTGTTKYIYIKGLMVPDGTDSVAMSQTVKHLAIANTFEGRTNESQRLVIRGWPGFTGGIDGGAQTDVAGFAADAAAGAATGDMSYITLRKLSFTNLDTSSQHSVSGKGYAIRLRALTYTTDHWTVESCTVNGVQSAANAAVGVIYLEGNADTTGLKVWRTTFANTQHTNKVEGLNALEIYRTSDVSIQRCTIETTAGDIFEKEGQRRAGAIGISVRFNLLKGTRFRISSQSDIPVYNNHIIQANVFDAPRADLAMFPIGFDHTGTDDGATRVWYANNLVKDHSFSTHAALVAVDNTLDALISFNNVFVDVTRPLRIDAGLNSPELMDFNVYDSVSSEWILPAATYTSLANLQAGTSYETNASTGDALVQPNYSFGSGSSVEGAGISGTNCGPFLTGSETIGAA